MVLTPATVRAAVLEQTERTKHCSKAEIERFIGDSELKIVSLDSQINALVELRDSQRACVLALKSIIAPVRTLPAELLAGIFELTIGDDTHVQDAYRVSHVCSHWRQVAHSTPQLWTRPLMVDLCEEKDVADGLKAWLARSFPLPLPISFAPVTTTMNPAIVEEVLTAAPRASSLLFPTASEYETPVSLVRRLAQAKLDSVEEICLGIVNETDHTPITFTVPRLRKFSIVNLGEPPIIIPWSQLTELTYRCGSSNVVLEVLSQCTNLISASITILGRSPLPEIRRDISVRFSHLRRLYLRFMADPTSFFDHLLTPVLQELRLELEGMHWIHTHLTAFQLRAPNITRLEFSFSRSLTSDDLVTAIRTSPSLTHLRLTCGGDCFDDAFIRTLHYKDGVAPLAPRLHDLVVWSDTVNFTEDVLAGMIASRWWTDTELASLVAPPAVPRWTHVELDMEYHFGPQFDDILKHIPSDVLRY
ncbi:hypothetical protein MSAN_01351000 [Mycena sanguinolenta]|uniref:F-box domain-containing protein n=1 Tax=Mycena sanguinolenta TaxID=230812 RepID=A0A8H6YFG4_9AGAR|nr:hypothetical protein MSAN_01351000 [Mycena sanguinolenta]